MLLRSALGMGIVMVLMGLAQNIWQFLILRALLGLLGGFVPNANALIAHARARNKSGWVWVRSPQAALAARALGPMAGGARADSYGLRPRILYYRQCAHTRAFSSPCFASEKNSSRSAKKRCCARGKW